MTAYKNTALRDLNWGLLSQGLNIASGLLLLPVVLIYLSSEEVGLWFVFSSLVGLAQLLELGFQPTIARYVAYIYAGSQRLEKVGIPENNEKGPLNQLLLGQVFTAAKRVYLWITLVVLFALLGCGSIYIISLLPPTLSWEKVVGAWVLFSLGFIANFYFGYYISFLQGRGDITASNQVVVVSRLIMIFVGSAVLFAGLGLVGLGLASLLSAIISRFLLHRLFWDIRRPEILKLKNSPPPIDQSSSSILWHNASKLGWVYLGAFLITRMNILIASSFLGLAVAASYALTFQILITLSSLASTLFTIKLPSLNAEQIRGRVSVILASFGQSLVVAWALFVSIAIILIIFGNSLLVFIGSHSKLLDRNLLALFAVIMLLEMNHGLCASYLTTHNEVVFVRPALISGFLIVTSSILLVSFYHLGVLGLLLSQGIVQLAYNNWKWPMEAANKMGCSFLHVLNSGITEIYSNLIVRRANF